MFSLGLQALFCALLEVSSQRSACPANCECFEAAKTVKCVSKRLRDVPFGVPENARNLFITGNHISRIGPESFKGLDNLATLSLTNNRITVVESHTFSSLLNLRSLDLSNNQLVLVHTEAFVVTNGALRTLNLSRSLRLPSLNSWLCRGSLDGLLELDLSGNGLVHLPAGTFSRLPALRRLVLARNSLVEIKNGTFSGLEQLDELDLSNNAFRSLGGEAQHELDHLTQARLLLGGNPYECSCGVEALVGWLNASLGRVGYPGNLLCASPPRLRNTSLLEVGTSVLDCHPSRGAQLTRQTSYALLGVVLVLVGVVFLFVLYLNRHGIQRWACDTRDACMEVLEGYHYHFQVDPNPRLAQVPT